MNSLSVWEKGEQIARRGKGDFLTLSPNREPVHRLINSQKMKPLLTPKITDSSWLIVQREVLLIMAYTGRLHNRKGVTTFFRLQV